MIIIFGVLDVGIPNSELRNYVSIMMYFIVPRNYLFLIKAEWGIPSLKIIGFSLDTPVIN